ncbi:MAG: DUF2975 domain-containing protein [Oscillospiraceae bacterium]|nr:DUF2975 domain-containing protein [Oscillospiraceae bacterium]
MNHSFLSARVTLWVNRGIMAALAVLMPLMPGFTGWLVEVRPLTDAAGTAILTAFYCCCVPVTLALLRLDGLMRNILAGDVFVHANVNHIRLIRWCCLAVSLICLPAAYFYLPLIFMAVIMAFLSLVVNVVSQVMKAAVAIREENDLTV